MFEELKQLAEKELQEKIDKTIESINQQIAEGEFNWYAAEYLTKLQQEKILSGKDAFDKYKNKVIEKIRKKDKTCAKIDATIFARDDISKIIITVDYSAKSKTWRIMPNAEVKLFYQNTYNTETFYSENIGGYGFDKESTATGQALNQCRSLLKMLYVFEEKRLKTDKTRREFIGYGSGYGVLPYFEGGVGFDCHRHILEKLGFTFQHVGNGKKFDVYQFTKGNK